MNKIINVDIHILLSTTLVSFTLDLEHANQSTIASKILTIFFFKQFRFSHHGFDNKHQTEEFMKDNLKFLTNQYNKNGKTDLGKEFTDFLEKTNHSHLI